MPNAATAVFGFVAQVPTVQITGGPVSATGGTATTGLVAQPGTPWIGTIQPGDPYRAPTIISGSSSASWASGAYKREPDEPTDAYPTVYQSRWFSYADGPGTLNITVTAASTSYITYVEVWDVIGGNSADPGSWRLDQNATFTGAGSASLTVNYVAPNIPVVIRVGTNDSGTTGVSYTLDYALTPVSTGGFDPGASSPTGSILEVLTPEIDITPASVLFSMFEAGENTTVTLTLSPDPGGVNPLGTYDTDDTGCILGGTALLPAIPAGSYTLKGTSTDGSYGYDNFTVAESPVTEGVDEGTDGATAETGTGAWQFVDPAGVLSSFTFTYNPTRMTSPWAPRQFTAEESTYGQAILWEAPTTQKAYEWQFSGYVDTQADLQAMQDFFALQRRIKVVDHRDRTWVVVLTRFDPQPKRVIGKPYATNYTFDALIFGGPL